MPERGEPGNVSRVERIAVRGKVVEGGLDVDGLPEHDDVDHDAEAVELVFLTDLVVLTELAALPVEDVAGLCVAAFAPAEQAVDSAAIGGVVDVFEHVQRLDHPAEFGQGTGEAGGVRAALQGAQDRPEPTWEAVCASLAGGPAPVAAFDALVSCFGDNARKLAALSSIHDRPADTRDLRASLGGTGHDQAIARLREGLR